MTSSGASEKWRVVGASVQGAGHLKTDTPCQDAHHFFLSNDGMLFAAVSDGAGSASRAEDAARLAALTAIARMRSDSSEATYESLLPLILERVREQLLRCAETQGTDAREFSCTLLLLIASSDWVAVAQVGDGAVVVEDAGDNVFALTKPQTGEHANETVFLVSPSAVEQAEIVFWRGAVKNIAVFTDGLQRLALKLPGGSAHTPFFAPLFQFISEINDAAAGEAQLESFLRSPRITERADDDLTLLLAHRAA